MVDPHRTSAMHVASSAEAVSCIVCTLQLDHAGENRPKFLKAASTSTSRYQKARYPTQTLKSARRWQLNATPLSLRNGQHLLAPHSQRSSSRNAGELGAMYVCSWLSQRCLCHPISFPLDWEECSKAGGRGRLRQTTLQDKPTFLRDRRR